MYEKGRPTWPTRSPLDPASVRSFFEMVVGVLLDKLCSKAIEDAVDGIRESKRDDDKADPSSV